MTGIYTITNKINNKIYVGYAFNIHKRIEYHIKRLLQNKHNNNRLQNSFNKYGLHNFSFDLLVECKKEYCCSEEHFWCNQLKSHDPKFGFNMRPTNPNNSNSKLSENAKKLIGLKNRNFRHTPEMISYMSISKKGKPCHPNTILAAKNLKNRYKFNSTDLERAAKTKYKKVYQYDLSLNLVNEFDSVKNAIIKTGNKRQNIESVCTGRNKTSAGFIWSYKKL